MMRIKDYGKHQCNLQAQSDSCLPVLPPQSGRVRRTIQGLRKMLTVNKINKKATLMYRSLAAVMYERRRQIYTVPPFIIHPFSKFCIYVEVVMCISWIFGYLMDPLFIAFFYRMPGSPSVDAWELIFLTMTSTQAIHICLSFITGYQITKTKEVVLTPKKIVLHYVKTYFLIDLLGCIPFRFIVIYNQINVGMRVYHNVLHAIQLLKYFRIVTAMQYLRQITLLLRASDQTHMFICIVLLTILILHTWACMVYFVHILMHYVDEIKPENSWIYSCGISIYHDRVYFLKKYLFCLHKVMCHFYASGTGMYKTRATSENTTLSLVIISGWLYYMFCLVITIQLTSSSNAAETKYERFLYQLNDYMRAKNLPIELRHRIILYYEHRFRKKFFREQAILSTLSDHLRLEVFLQSCKYLLEKVKFFQDLPKQVVGTILGALKQEVFLPNDVIIKAGTETYAMYFISHGTVACYTTTGHEWGHLYDGEHFGAFNLIRMTHEVYTHNIVAIEMTECYRWDRADYVKCVAVHTHISELFDKFVRSIRDSTVTDEEYREGSDTDVLFELRHHRIIESGRPRR